MGSLILEVAIQSEYDKKGRLKNDTNYTKIKVYNDSSQTVHNTTLDPLYQLPPLTVTSTFN